MRRSVPARWSLAAAAALLVSVLPVVVDQEYLLLATDPAELAESADNGRRAATASDGVPTGWWRLGWWSGTGPEEARPASTPPAARPARTAGRTNQQAAAPVSPASAGRLGVPATVLSAYRGAAARLKVLDPGCRLSWEMLAGIGKVESGHASGGYVTSRGNTVRPILGPRLDGSRFAAISDTDDGRLDGDSAWDRAVGPMQFIPSSWEHFASDGNADGTKSPHNVFDAALASGVYLCVGRGDLSRSDDLFEALYRYNHSTPYVQTVHAWIRAYREGGATATATDPARAPRAVGGAGTSPGRPPAPTSSPGPTDPSGPSEPSPSEPGPGERGPEQPGPGRPGPDEPAPAPTPSRSPTPSPGPTPPPGPSPAPFPSPWCPVEPLPVCVELPPLGDALRTPPLS